MALERITDEKLNDFLKVFFLHPEEILDKEHEELYTDNIMMATVDVKRLFVTHLLQRYLAFNHNKNSFIYHEVLMLLGLEPRIKLKEKKKKIVDKRNISEQNFLNEFWNAVELYFSEFEVILNVYWRKGVDAEISGMTQEQVMKVIDHALYMNESNLKKHYYELLEKLELMRNSRLEEHKYHLPFSLIEEAPIKSDMEMDEREKIMFESLERFRVVLEETITFFNQVFISSFDADLELRKEKRNDSELIEETQDKIKKRWKGLEDEWGIVRKRIS